MVTSASDAGEAQILLALVEVRWMLQDGTDLMKWAWARPTQTWVQGFVSVLREGHGKSSVANASLEVLFNPRMLIQAQHDRLLLIPLPFAWCETASLTIMLLPIYSIPLQSISLWTSESRKDSAHSFLAKLSVGSVKYTSILTIAWAGHVWAGMCSKQCWQLVNLSVIPGNRKVDSFGMKTTI